MGPLEECRAEIDRLDRQLLELLGRRFVVCRDVARHKQAHGMPVLQPARAAIVKRRAVALGAAHSLDSSFVEALYELIMAEACRLQDEIV